VFLNCICVRKDSGDKKFVASSLWITVLSSSSFGPKHCIQINYIIGDIRLFISPVLELTMKNLFTRTFTWAIILYIDPFLTFMHLRDIFRSPQ
jgi:hypothetical protein